MNREIKFRAWDQGSNKFIEIESIVIARNNMPTSIESNGRFIQVQQSQQAKLYQFTGVLDRNGIEICEGDYVRRHWDSSEPEDRIVQFIDGAFYWGGDKHKALLCQDWAEVVGNVHEGKLR